VNATNQSRTDEAAALLAEAVALHAKVQQYVASIETSNGLPALLAEDISTLDNPRESLQELTDYYTLRSIGRQLTWLTGAVTSRRFNKALKVANSEPRIICEYCTAFNRLLRAGAVRLDTAAVATAGGERGYDE
jgi:hypothetical protein